MLELPSILRNTGDGGGQKERGECVVLWCASLKMIVSISRAVTFCDY